MSGAPLTKEIFLSQRRVSSTHCSSRVTHPTTSLKSWIALPLSIVDNKHAHNIPTRSYYPFAYMFTPTVLSATLTAGVLAVLTTVVWMTMLSRGRSRRIVPPADQVLTHEGVATSTYIPKRFNVLVWNVEKGHERDFATDFERLTSASGTTTTTPHLILLQEYLGSSKVKNALSATAMRYDIATSFLYETDQEQVRTGVATGSIAAGPPLSVFAEITKDVEPIVKTHKATIITRYPLQDDDVDDNAKEKVTTSRSLLVVNIHGRNRGGGLQPLSQQLQRVKQYIESHDGPVIFAGDFNTNSAAKREWLLTYAQTELKLTAVTFDGAGGDHRTRSKLSREPLDWVFVRGLSVEASSVPRVSGSDHNPMLVTLAVRQTSESGGGAGGRSTTR